MPAEKESQRMTDILKKANQILKKCNEYISKRIQQEQISSLSGIKQVERIFDFEAEFFIINFQEYVRLKKYEDMLFLETDQIEFYKKHLQCIQNGREALINAIACGIEDGSIRKEIEPKQEAAVLEGAFGSVLRSECGNSKQINIEGMNHLLKECVQISMEYLKNDIDELGVFSA